jgi:hypothetical protein
MHPHSSRHFERGLIPLKIRGYALIIARRIS